MRWIFLGSIALIGFVTNWWLFAIVALWYSYLYVGIEVLVLAVCIDAIFALPAGLWPLYSIGAAIGLLIAQFALPHKIA